MSVVLSVTVIASAFAIGIPMVSARGETPFQDNECIYIDCRQQLSGGNYWDSSGAELRVFTYYNDSDAANFCHEFEEDFQNDNWFTGANVLQKGIKADKFCDHVYRFRIPSDKLSHVRIARTDSGANNKWNLSPYMWDNQRSKDAGSKHNCIKITGWDNSASWTNFTPSKSSSYNSKTAALDSSITGNSNLYTIDAKYYDYYNDDEIQKGWGNINYSSNHATVHYTKNNSWYWWDGYWEPFSYLNNKIASVGGNYPMYFGNFYGKNDGYTGEGSSGLVSFNNKVNNSNNIDGNHKSVAGLTGGTLNSDKNIVYATSNGYNSNTVVPFFDDSFLDSNGVGSVISSKFPMRKVTDSTTGITTYTFDSEGATDNVWINNATGSSPTVSYGSGTSYGAKDSLYSYSDRQASGYGFFPFDSTRGTTAEAKNYGFGLRVDIPFNLGSQEGHIGQLYGLDNQWHDQIFNFTGDDDVWVYVDGKLILDLGGDHKKTVGSINFHTKVVSANIGATFNDATRNQNNFTLENEDDPTAEHTLTMFYVERGMIESNLSFNFNFAPVANQLITEKKVNTTELNAGIKNAYALKNADKFSFNSEQLNGKTYTYAHTNASGTRSGADYIVSNNKFYLRDQDTATFNDQLTAGQTVNVTESFPSDNALTYNKTSWIVVDTNDNDSVVAQSSASTAQSLNSSFTFKTNKTGQFDPTKLKLTFTNTPAKANAVISKNVVDSNNNDVTDTKSFPATVYLSFDKGATYNAYPLTYTVTGATASSTMSNGQVTLQEGKNITISNLPVGTYVKVVENASGLGGYTNTSGDVVMVVAASGASTTITNKQSAPQEADGTITGTKHLDGQLYKSGTRFEYTLKGVPKFTGDGSNVKDTSTLGPNGNGEGYTISSTDANGKFTFSGSAYGLHYTEEGVYRYIVTEKVNENSLYTHGGNDYQQIVSSSGEESKYNKFLVVITVTKNNATNELEAVTASRGYDSSAPGKDDFTINADNAADIVFYNRQTPGSVKITKKDQNNQAVEGVTFALYRVDAATETNLTNMASDEARYDYIKANLTPYKTAVSTENGVAGFNDLPIFEYNASTGKYNYSSYQNYRIIEYSVPEGTNLNKTTQGFTIPQQDNSNNWIYDLEFGYVNGKMINPYTGYISPAANFRTVGLCIIAGALALGAFFILRRKKVFARYKKKH